MADLLPFFMFVPFTLLILAGYPIAFTICGTALIFGMIAFGIGFFDLLPLRIWGVMTNFTLIAVPLFIFMGSPLNARGWPGIFSRPWGSLSAVRQAAWPFRS